MKKVAFVTCQQYPAITDDDRLAVEQLRAIDIEVSPLIWDDSQTEYRDFQAVIFRSCWNYHLKYAQFKSWLDKLASEGVWLWNSHPVVRWNLHKGYLKDLAANDVNIPKTIWLKAGASTDLKNLLIENGMAEAVIKPAVSLSAYQTWRTSVNTATAQQSDFDQLVSHCDVMVQSFVDEVLSQGEISFVFFAGKFSHAVCKRPKPGDFRAQLDYGGSRELIDPPSELISQAQYVLTLVNSPLLYARVDCVNVDGKLVLMELELIDPVLFLKYNANAAKLFAEAIAISIS